MSRHVSLAVPEPFARVGVLHFWRMGVVPGVEAVVADGIARALSLPHGPCVVTLRATETGVEVTLRGDPRDDEAAVAWARGMVGADHDAVAADAALAADPLLAPLVAAAPGLRVHVDGDRFSVLVRSVIGQQVSVAGARTLTARMVAAVGERLADDPDPSDHEPGVTHLFPTPEAVAGLVPEDFAMPRARGRAVIALSRAVADGALDLGAEPEKLRPALLARPGIGPWTVDHLALRALGDPDAFLPTDIGVRRGAQRLGTDLPSVVARSEAWRPWRSLALTHLWLVATS